ESDAKDEIQSLVRFRLAEVLTGEKSRHDVEVWLDMLEGRFNYLPHVIKNYLIDTLRHDSMKKRRPRLVEDEPRPDSLVSLSIPGVAREAECASLVSDVDERVLDRVQTEELRKRIAEVESELIEGGCGRRAGAILTACLLADEMPSQKELAGQLGISARQLRSDLAEIKKKAALVARLLFVS
ncbi:MAG: hypothetical protein ABIH26_08335, partial [Candidatus Eisenbacteria bacterium]